MLPRSMICAWITLTMYLLAGAEEASGTKKKDNLANQSVTSNVTSYAWSTWGKWSSCSRSCGGGVSVQERQCLPRDPSRWHRSRRRRKLVRRSDSHARVLRDVVAAAPDCPGLSKRYHECNTSPCPGPQRDSREQQCAVYDRRPFHGRFYTWVPYVDGNAPCTLNCRPRGQQFYASLALVADGTPCTKPGFRALCVQGSCRVVGREILASTAMHEVHCGRHLVSGLFTRPRLPLGYSYVATVPRGACRLNVSELVASENYIALKVTNGSFIMNGEFAVSAPGMYDAAGARFQYTRKAGLDSVYAHGPIHHPIDIMVLYTRPNPNIKYEYFTDSASDETSIQHQTSDENNIPHPSYHQRPRHHRHQNSETNTKALQTKSEANKPDLNQLESQSQISNVIGDRQFAWKILSFTQCSRTCGGGLQIGKFRCVEVSVDREVSPAYCNGAPPPSRRRRCGLSPCPPRWRAAAWGACPVCGPAHRTRIVGCVQDHARGITKISDQKCPLPMPPSQELCNIPNCDGSASSTPQPRLDSRRQVRPTIDHFRDGPVVSLAGNSSSESPTTAPNYSFSAAGGWLYSEWSECVGWCHSGGVQSRSVRCTDPSGCNERAPISTQSCTLRKQCEAQWFTGDWSRCSAGCDGKQVRGVMCVSHNFRRLRDTMCSRDKPPTERACGGTCAPTWYLSDWGECKGPCESAIQSRTVWCARGGEEGAKGAAKDSECPGVRPAARQSCVPPRCTTRPVVKPNPIVTDTQQRVTRHQNQSPNIEHFRDKSSSKGPCADTLNNCALAVQARLCHYPYYAEYCCHSCHGR